jgi:hypothetical protein
MPNTGRQNFAALLRHILVTEQNRKLKDIAEQVVLSARNFYGRVTGRIQFTPEEINRVLRAVPDPRLGDWLLAGTELGCTHRTHAAVPTPVSTAVDIALASVEQTMGALRNVLQMHPPRPATVAAITATAGHVEEAQRQLATLLATLNARQPAPA